MERLREALDRLNTVRAQLHALPARQIQRIEDLEATALTLSTQGHQLNE